MREAYEVLFSQAEAELADILWSDYDDILFISKSIGTIIAACKGQWISAGENIDTLP